MAEMLAALARGRSFPEELLAREDLPEAGPRSASSTSFSLAERKQRSLPCVAQENGPTYDRNWEARGCKHRRTRRRRSRTTATSRRSRRTTRFRVRRRAPGDTGRDRPDRGRRSVPGDELNATAVEGAGMHETGIRDTGDHRLRRSRGDHREQRDPAVRRCAAGHADQRRADRRERSVPGDELKQPSRRPAASRTSTLLSCPAPRRKPPRSGSCSTPTTRRAAPVLDALRRRPAWSPSRGHGRPQGARARRRRSSSVIRRLSASPH